MLIRRTPLAVNLPADFSLAFPAGRTPGYDPSHAASGYVDGSGHALSTVVAGSKNFVNLVDDQVGVTTGAVVSGYDDFGPFVTFVASSGIEFPGQLSGVTETRFTLACIYKPSATTNIQFIVGNAGLAGSTGLQLLFNSTGVLSFSSTGQSAKDSNITYTAGVPYFAIISVNWTSVGPNFTNINFLLMDMRTGFVRSQATAQGASQGTNNGTYMLGNIIGNSTTKFAGGNLYAAMCTPTYLSVGEMLQWALDPWAFWYPGTVSRVFGQPPFRFLMPQACL